MLPQVTAGIDDMTTAANVTAVIEHMTAGASMTAGIGDVTAFRKLSETVFRDDYDFRQFEKASIKSIL